jgi:CheY-like chemotaxis protein
MAICLAMVEPLAHKRGISMSFPRFDAPCLVDGDPIRIKQVLINLIYNAIKYNRPAGTVAVECAFAAPNAIRISVRDTGLGLAPEQLAQLFQPFNRLGQEASTEQGTGIGLVVSKRLVELMGGVIGADSNVGIGSVFWIELGLATSAPSAVVKAQPTEPTGSRPHDGTAKRTVLYVEDNPANLELVEELMKRRPELSLLTAADGNLGVECARTYLPDVILMDIHLPGISGLAAMNTLRADPSTMDIPIIALSAHALPGDIEKALEAGFFNYLTKPIEFNAFMTALDLALEFSRKKSASGDNEAPTAA